MSLGMRCLGRGSDGRAWWAALGGGLVKGPPGGAGGARLSVRGFGYPAGVGVPLPLVGRDAGPSAGICGVSLLLGEIWFG